MNLNLGQTYSLEKTSSEVLHCYMWFGIRYIGERERERDRERALVSTLVKPTVP
jgi:hypothetical protein